MDIKRMHNMIETLTECAERQFAKGIERVNAKEMGEVIDMIKDLAEAEYYRKITVAMDESEYGREYDYKGRKGYMMTPEMYREREPEYYRDMDRQKGKMYYTETLNHDTREGKSGQMRKYYMESKEMGKDKGEKMKSLEEYMKSIAEDITEAIEGASPEERSMTKQKLQMIAQKM